MRNDQSRGSTPTEASIRGWKRAATVFAAAALFAPPIAGLLALAARFAMGWAPKGDMPSDLIGLAGTHAFLGYVFGALPAAASGLVLSNLVWRRGAITGFTTVTVSAICTLAYCLVADVVFSGALARVLSPELVVILACLTVATSLIVHATLRWARFI